MLRLRPDERSTKERVERPTAVTMPKLTSTMPPSTGSGSMVSRAPNFPHIPLARKIRPAVKNAHRLATWRTRLRHTLSAVLSSELCESGGGLLGSSSLTVLTVYGLFVPNSPYGLCGRKAILKREKSAQSCVKVEVAVLGSLSLISLTVSVVVKQHWSRSFHRAKKLCESGGGRTGLCGHKQHFKNLTTELRSCVKVEMAVLGSSSIIVLKVSVDVSNILRS